MIINITPTIVGYLVPRGCPSRRAPSIPGVIVVCVVDGECLPATGAIPPSPLVLPLVHLFTRAGKDIERGRERETGVLGEPDFFFGFMYLDERRAGLAEFSFIASSTPGSWANGCGLICSSR